LPHVLLNWAVPINLSRFRDFRYPGSFDLRNADSRSSDFHQIFDICPSERAAQIRSGFFTWDFPEFLLPGLPISRFPISRNGRSRDTWPPSFGRLRSILGVFAPVHWGLNPRVAPNISNGCRVFQSRSDGSDRLLLGHSCMTLWTWKNRRSRHSLGPWRSTIRKSSLSTKTQKTKGVRLLTSLPFSYQSNGRV
jgi:hypothetical protein